MGQPAAPQHTPSKPKGTSTTKKIGIAVLAIIALFILFGILFDIIGTATNHTPSICCAIPATTSNSSSQQTEPKATPKQ